MLIDPQQLPPRDMYRLMITCITPRPIAWVSTISPRGISNLAPFSFFNGVCARPPTVVFCPVNHRDGSKKDTLRNIEAVPEFVINVVSGASAEKMNQSSAELDYEVSEFEKVGVSAVPSTRIRPFRVAESPVQFECKLMQIVRVGEAALGGNLVIGEIVAIHVDEGVLDDAGRVDAVKLDTIGRMEGNWYCRSRERFELPRPG